MGSQEAGSGLRCHEQALQHPLLVDGALAGICSGGCSCFSTGSCSGVLQRCTS
jgi:hypothetical protein